MKMTIRKWGNSAAVRIPASVMEAVHLDLDQIVEVREQAGRIIIEPVRRKNYDLEELVRGITARNRHDSIDFGRPTGNEIW